MSTYNISINIDNAAFGDEPGREVIRILHNIADHITDKGTERKYSLRDYNGNIVGEAKVIEP